MTIDEQMVVRKVAELVNEGRAFGQIELNANNIQSLQILLNMVLKREEDIKHLIDGMRTYEKRLGIDSKYDDDEYLKHDECRICGKHPSVYCKVCYDKVVNEKDKLWRDNNSYEEREQAILDVLGVDY